jgi:hypothetical protein
VLLTGGVTTGVGAGAVGAAPFAEVNGGGGGGGGGGMLKVAGGVTT